MLLNVSGSVQATAVFHACTALRHALFVDRDVVAMNVFHIVEIGCEGFLLKLDVALTCSYVCEILQTFQGPPLFIMPRLLNNFSINGLLFIYSSMISCYLSFLNESPCFCTEVRFCGHLVSLLEELGRRHFHGGYEFGTIMNLSLAVVF